MTKNFKKKFYFRIARTYTCKSVENFIFSVTDAEKPQISKKMENF